MRTQYSAKKKLPLKKMLLVFSWLILLCGLFLGYREIKKSTDFMPIKNVKITASYQHIDPQTLETLISPYVMGTGLFSVNIKLLKSALLTQLPWVDQVYIKRTWPDEIDILIKEQKPIAMWNDNALLNVQGKIFAPDKNSFPKELPYLYGTDQQLVLQQYQKFNNQLHSLNLNITQLTMNSRGSWEMTLSNAMQIVFGREDIDNRFIQFLDIYPKLLASHDTQIKKIDLRYSDGLAVEWR